MGGRRQRATFPYSAFVPDPIVNVKPVVSFETASAVAEAETAIRALNEQVSVRGLEAIGPLLLRSEAVASSRIEGYDISPLNLARALIDPRAARGTARTVAANVSAMEEAVAIGARASAISIDDLLAIHRTLMASEARARPGHRRPEGRHARIAVTSISQSHSGRQTSATQMVLGTRPDTPRRAATRRKVSR